MLFCFTYGKIIDIKYQLFMKRQNTISQWCDTWFYKCKQENTWWLSQWDISNVSRKIEGVLSSSIDNMPVVSNIENLPSEFFCVHGITDWWQSGKDILSKFQYVTDVANQKSEICTSIMKKNDIHFSDAWSWIWVIISKWKVKEVYDSDANTILNTDTNQRVWIDRILPNKETWKKTIELEALEVHKKLDWLLRKSSSSHHYNEVVVSDFKPMYGYYTEDYHGMTYGEFEKLIWDLWLSPVIMREAKLYKPLKVRKEVKIYSLFGVKTINKQDLWGLDILYDNLLFSQISFNGECYDIRNLCGYEKNQSSIENREIEIISFWDEI